MHQVGVDIVEIGRIGQAISRWGEHWLRRIYTDEELRYCRQRLPQLAARFAAKEAVMKALGTGRRGVAWREIEVVSRPGCPPQVRLHGRAKLRAEELGLSELGLSLSHSRQWAVAAVVAGQTPPPAKP